MLVFSMVERPYKLHYLSVYEDVESVHYLPWSKRDVFAHIRLQLLVKGAYGKTIKPLNVENFMALTSKGSVNAVRIRKTS